VPAPRICPICELETDAHECPHDGFPTLDRKRYTRRIPTNLIGRVFEGKYKIIKAIGKGGMGSVFLAEQKPIGRKVALKCLNPEGFKTKEVRLRFVKEARVLSSLEHPNTVRVYDFGISQEGILYLVMEYVLGKPLSDVMEDAGPMPFERAVRIAVQILRALDEVHDVGIVHRDLKPLNILLKDHRTERDRVKVLDFGIARSYGTDGETNITQEGIFVGTPQYASPEQAVGLPDIDGRSDLFGVGVLVYEMLSGQLPFAGVTPVDCLTRVIRDAPRELPVDVVCALPPETGAFLARALEKRRERRFQSAAEMIRALTRIPMATATGREDPSSQAADAGVVVTMDGRNPEISPEAVHEDEGDTEPKGAEQEASEKEVDTTPDRRPIVSSEDEGDDDDRDDEEWEGEDDEGDVEGSLADSDDAGSGPEQDEPVVDPGPLSRPPSFTQEMLQHHTRSRSALYLAVGAAFVASLFLVLLWYGAQPGGLGARSEPDEVGSPGRNGEVVEAVAARTPEVEPGADTKGGDRLSDVAAAYAERATAFNEHPPGTPHKTGAESGAKGDVSTTKGSASRAPEPSRVQRPPRHKPAAKQAAAKKVAATKKAKPQEAKAKPQKAKKAKKAQARTMTCPCGSLPACLNFAESYRKRGRDDLRRACLESALKFAPPDSSAHGTIERQIKSLRGR
jgi:eukaryotic-like serine/threonine-protein kinase